MASDLLQYTTSHGLFAEHSPTSPPRDRCLVKSSSQEDVNGCWDGWGMKGKIIFKRYSPFTIEHVRNKHQEQSSTTKASLTVSAHMQNTKLYAHPQVPNHHHLTSLSQAGCKKRTESVNLLPLNDDPVFCVDLYNISYTSILLPGEERKGKKDTGI